MLATVYGGTKVETQSKLVVSSNRNPMALNKREAISEVPTREYVTAPHLPYSIFRLISLG